MSATRFTASQTPLADLTLLQRHPIGDERGYLERLFCRDELGDLLGTRRIEQMNHTLTARAGSLRGMHFQHPPHAEMKLVTCLRGEVLDVVVDLRRGSPTLLRWHAERLSAENHRTLLIPEGFAHGFQTLTDDCELIYLHTNAYRPDAEGALNALDPRLAINWPLPVTEMSDRDRAHPSIANDFVGIRP
jgi:dTDP-4-dehydrorhamnose 3,5-epimerase